MEFDHVGIPAPSKRDGMRYLESKRLWLTSPTDHPYRVEWLWYEDGSPEVELVRTMPHVAYRVESLEEALVGHRVVAAPFDVFGEVRVAFVDVEGAPVSSLSPPETFVLGGDLEVRRLGFGAMRLCGPRIMGWPRDREGALAVLRRALELGVNLIDTSDAYGPEVNELQIAEALHPYPEGLVIATKGGLHRDRAAGWPEDGRPEHLREACEGSLGRLRLERIDVYQLHAVDPKVPIEESVGELARLREEGKIRHIGLSNVDTGQLRRARAVAPIVSVQNRYSLSDRASDDVLDECEREGLGLPWFPLASGSLTRPGGLLDRAADRTGVTSAQVALAWLLRRSPAMLPIPGTSSIEHLEENVAAAGVRLDDEVFEALAAA